MKGEYKDIEQKMDKTIHFLIEEFATIRAGRANPQMLAKIMVDYYGTATPINQLANVSAPEPRTLIIQPWDVSTLKEIEKAILKSELGINPNNDGKVLRLNFPQLTEDRRKELVKTVSKKGEEAKIAIRSIRRDAIEVLKKQKSKSEITEDDLKDAEKDMQQLTDKYTKKIDEHVKSKEKEIMEI